MLLRRSIMVLILHIVPALVSAEETMTAENLAIAMDTILGGMSFAFTAIRTILATLGKVVVFIFWVFAWLFGMVWNAVLVQPLRFVAYVVSTLYPVILFCLAAVACGLLIGTCAGLAAEGFSFALLAATWGHLPTKDIVQVQKPTGEMTEKHPDLEQEEEEENESLDEDDEDARVPSTSTYTKESDEKKGKAPARPRKEDYIDLRTHVESWRRNTSDSSVFMSPEEQTGDFGLRRRKSQ